MKPAHVTLSEECSREIAPLVESLVGSSSEGAAVLDAWFAVCRFLDETGIPTAFAAEVEALLLAKVLEESGLSEESAWLCARVGSLQPFAGRIPLDRLSIAGILAICSGILRGVERTALCNGACIVLDGEPLRKKQEFAMDLTILPTLRMLMDDAIAILDASGLPGVMILKGWAAERPDIARREFAEDFFARRTARGIRHHLIWAGG